ncbi:unnamed protein product, partial [Amoebophrya sp. A120]
GSCKRSSPDAHLVRSIQELSDLLATESVRQIEARMMTARGATTRKGSKSKTVHDYPCPLLCFIRESHAAAFMDWDVGIALPPVLLIAVLKADGVFFPAADSSGQF